MGASCSRCFSPLTSTGSCSNANCPASGGAAPPPAPSEPELGGVTLATARAELVESLDEGTICPCCGQYARRYRRKLNSGMARTLIWMVQYYLANGRTWIDVPRVAPAYVLRSNEHGKLTWWGLATLKPNQDDSSKRTSGIWRPTEKGVAFALAQTTLPAKVVLYNNECEGFEGEQINIRQALGNKFDYEELMRG